MRPLFITGIGTDVGKTLVSAILTEALQAAYWKPVQAGFAQGTDSQWIAGVVSDPDITIFPETYKLSMPASPHIAAREEGVQISLDRILEQFRKFTATPPPSSQAFSAVTTPPPSARPGPGSAGFLVIEGAGGLLVPLNDHEFVLDLALRLDAAVILVSRNYLGSINHSLMTAAICKARGLKVAGWIFNDQYGHYEPEIVRWSGIRAIASIPFSDQPDRDFVRGQASRIREDLLRTINV